MKRKSCKNCEKLRQTLDEVQRSLGDLYNPKSMISVEEIWNFCQKALDETKDRK